ncbi:HVC33 protein, partial [Atlantisia rogersi]|nr:HVC33 protein [Atlantisia rogersi]
QILLVESGGGLQEPGNSVKLTCHGSGFKFQSADIWWYRQAPGDKFEWVSYINNDRGTRKDYATAVKDRATASRDNSQSKSFLELQDLHPQDSARYFCGVLTESGNPSELKHK